MEEKSESLKTSATPVVASSLNNKEKIACISQAIFLSCAAIAIYFFIFPIALSAIFGIQPIVIDLASETKKILPPHIMVTSAIALALGYFSIYELNLKNLHFFCREKKASLKKSALIIALGFLACIAINFSYSFIIEYFQIKIAPQHAAETATQLFKTVPLATFLGTTLAAPLAEEVIFRGLTQKLLTPAIHFIPSLLLSSCIFSAFHRDMDQAIPLALMGATFGLAYHFSGRLSVAIFVHAANNIFSIIFILTSPINHG